MATGILKDLADGAKRLGEIKKEFSDLEFNERILELRQLLVSAQSEIVTLREEKLDLEGQLSDIKIREDEAATLTEVQGFCFDEVDGRPHGLPYCPLCKVKEGILIRLSKQNNEFSRCANCQTIHNAGANGRVNEDSPPFDMGD